MDPQIIFDAVVGPLGALVISIGLLLLIIRGQWLVPKYVFEKVEARANLLEEENSELNESVKTLIVQNAEQKGSIEMLNAQLVKLREEVEALRMRLNKATGQ